MLTAQTSSGLRYVCLSQASELYPNAGLALRLALICDMIVASTKGIFSITGGNLLSPVSGVYSPQNIERIQPKYHNIVSLIVRMILLEEGSIKVEPRSIFKICARISKSSRRSENEQVRAISFHGPSGLCCERL